MSKKLFLIFSFLLLSFLSPHSVSAADPTYDYYAKEIILEPTYPTVNQDVVIKIKVENKGSQAATSTAGLNNYLIEFDNFEKSSVTLPDITEDNAKQLRPGMEAFYTINGKFTIRGLRKLTFTIDPNNTFPETNENNNSVSRTIRVETYDDLAIEDITLVPEKPTINQDVMITVKGKNAGNRSLFSDKGFNSYLADFPDFVMTEKASSTNPLMSSPVKPGENFYLNYIGHFIATGTKQLAYTIDIADELPEFKIDAATDFVTSDSNNKFSKSIVVLPEQHDYAIDAFTFQTNLKHIVNYDTTILVSIKNKGSDYWTTGKGLTKDSSQFGNDVAAYFPGFVIASSSQDTFPTINNPIKPDGIYNYYYSGRFNSVGAHDLTFKIDANDKIIETNKSNNATSTTVNVYLTEPDADVFKFLGYNLENISSSSVRFNWKTNENTTGKVVYRFKCCEFPQMEVPSDVAGTTDGKKDHSVVVSGLIPDVGYYYKVVATRGSVDYDTGMREFWTPADNTIKFTDGPTALIDSVKKNANISWSTNLIASAKLYYGLANTGQYSFVGTTTPFSHYEYTINNLDYAKYQYYIVASSTASTTITSNLNEFSLSLPIIAPKESSALPISLAPQFNRVSGNEILPISNAELFKKLKGQILLKVEDAGQAWYVCPLDANKYYLGRPEDAFNIMRNLSIGITNADLKKIQIGGEYVPKSKREDLVYAFASQNKGKIFIQVESKGEAWYINPSDAKRYYLGRPKDAYIIMRELSIGINNEDFIRL